MYWQKPSELIFILVFCIYSSFVLLSLFLSVFMWLHFLDMFAIISLHYLHLFMYPYPSIVFTGKGLFKLYSISEYIYIEEVENSCQRDLF
jgi:hypothetical protein